MNHKVISLLILFVVIISSGFGCKLPDQETKKLYQPIVLKYWRVFDGNDAFKEIIANYNALHDNIRIEYRKLRFDEYEDALLEAFATDRGPDIFSIHNSWMYEFKNKGLISPMPDVSTMVHSVIKGTIKKEKILEKVQTKAMTPTQLRDLFPDVVYNDVLIPTVNKDKSVSKKIYGLPLSIDTLAMFVNRDLFNNASITNPPEYWNENFQQNVRKLTKQNNRGEILQSGVALGGSDNIVRSPDIMAALMMQNGTEMMDDGGHVTFAEKPKYNTTSSVVPGIGAIKFYADFSDPGKETYCWNNTLDNSMNMFIRGKLAMMFGYSYMLPEIRALNPKLNFSIYPLPQIEGNEENINFANYWVEVVSNKSKHKDAAWDFVRYITKKNQAKSYLEKTHKPTALRSLIEEQMDDQDIGIFARQILTSRSWYHGSDAGAMEKIMKEMIDKINQGEYTYEEAVENAAKKVQQTINLEIDD